MNILYKLGQNPTKSFRYFLSGLVLFAIGLGLVYSGVAFSQNIQLIGLGLVALGCLLAIWGYVGIFASRLLTLMNKHPAIKNSK